MAVRLLLFLTFVKLLLHLYVNSFDNFFRDEFYYIACAEHLDFGYVDHPPLVALVAWFTRLVLGASLFAQRLPSALTGAVLVFLTGYLTYELGGKRPAQALSALCVLAAPGFTGIHGFYSMNVFDHLFWLAAMILLVRLMRQEKPGLWIALGVVLGIGLMNKISVLFLGFGMLTGILLTQNRKWLASRWIWLCAAIASIIFFPHIVWQIGYDFPTLEFMRNATLYKNVALSPLDFLSTCALEMNPLTLPVWAGGLWWFLVTNRKDCLQLFGWLFITVFITLVLNNGKPYYLTPAFPLLFSGGAVFIESLCSRNAIRYAVYGFNALLVTSGAMLAPLAVPILPPERFQAYVNQLGIEISAGEKHETGALPQHFADRMGWEEMVQQLAEIYHSLPPEEQAVCAIHASNYGQAGAIDYYAEKYNLPKSICQHNSYYLWGYRDFDGNLILTLSGRDGLDEAFESVEQVGTITRPLSMPYEDNRPVYLCRKLKVPFQQAWESGKDFN